MTETQHTPTELERLGEEPLPSADELAGRFPLTQNPNPTPQADYEKAMEELNFGTVFTDHMAHMRWTPETGWGQREVIPFGPLDLSPAAAVLHYGQSASKVSRPTVTPTAVFGHSVPASMPRV